MVSYFNNGAVERASLVCEPPKIRGPLELVPPTSLEPDCLSLSRSLVWNDSGSQMAQRRSVPYLNT